MTLKVGMRCTVVYGKILVCSLNNLGSVYARCKVRIGTIPELSSAKKEFSLCGSIPELYWYNSSIAQGILVA